MTNLKGNLSYLILTVKGFIGSLIIKTYVKALGISQSLQTS